MKDKIITISFLSFIYLISILHIVIPDKEISYVERRYLKEFPKFKLESSYITEVDNYLLDQMPGREIFRGIKGKFNYNILNRLDNNNIYLGNNYIFKSLYPTNYKSIDNFIRNINKLDSLLSENNNTYMAVIPDKNYYLDKELFLHIDYDYIYNNLNKLDMNFIDIRDILTLSDYYYTDTHWRQERLDKVVKRLVSRMGYQYKDITYNKNTYKYFTGVYYEGDSLGRDEEELIYLTNDILDNSYVYYLENSNLNSIYSLDKINSFDSYEVFLDGASSYIEISNESNNTSRELVVFRDSFGSSIIPLLVPYYSKITVIDNRYISSDNFSSLIEFNNQDVLFLYSTLVINDSGSLKG